MPKEDFYTTHYGQLTGKIVKAVVKSSHDSNAFYGLLFTDGSVAWIQRDEEGNGPGFLEIEGKK